MRDIEIRSSIGERPRKPVVLLAGNATTPFSQPVKQLEQQWNCQIERSRLDDLESVFGIIRPDILLMRVRLDEDREDILRSIRNLACGPIYVKVIVLADKVDAALAVECFRRGARGVIEEAGQSIQVLSKCLECVNQGQFWISNDLLENVMTHFSRPPERVVSLSVCGDVLSPREKEVMGLIIEGASNRQIADSLNISENTVKKYVYSIFNKRGVSSRVGLLRQVFQHERESA